MYNIIVILAISKERMSIYHTYNEEQLIEFLRSGDHAAFTEIYNRYWEKLANAAYQRLHSREDAEEVVQEVFVNLYSRRKELSPKSTIEAYLKTALKFKVIDAFNLSEVYKISKQPILPVNIISLKKTMVNPKSKTTCSFY